MFEIFSAHNDSVRKGQRAHTLTQECLGRAVHKHTCQGTGRIPTLRCHHTYTAFLSLYMRITRSVSLPVCLFFCFYSRYCGMGAFENVWGRKVGEGYFRIGIALDQLRDNKVGEQDNY